MKKILIISYFFPPCAKSGAFRALRIANEIKKYNWVPIILTVKNGYWGRQPRVDYNLLDDFNDKIYRTEIFYPCKSCNHGITSRLIRRIWSEITFPDGYITWTITAALKALQLINREKIDCVFITGPPFSPFLIAYLLKKYQRIPICIDYRDPWTGGGYYIRRKWKHYLSKKIEKKIISKVDRVYTVTPKMTEFIKENNSSDNRKFSTLTYFYSPEKDNIKENSIKSSNKFTLIFAGSAFGVADPKPLLKAVLMIKNKRSDVFDNLQVISIGDLMENHKEWINKNSLNEKVQTHNFMPYEKAINYMKNAHLLLLPYSLKDHMKLCLPVKLYDYFLINKPILYYGAIGQTWETIIETKTGYCRAPNDIEGIMNDICHIYDNHYIGNNEFIPNYEAKRNFYTDKVIDKFIRDIESMIL